MEASIRLGRILGIPIGLHYSWAIIALLITFALAAHFRTTNPEWAPATVWISALITGVLFFGSIIVHELSHALVARADGIPVKSITLFALGGVAQMEKDAARAKTEFWMGIAGPITSVAIGVGCLGVATALGWDPGTLAARPVVAIFVWLGYINILLAIFNMIPGFPLDGGRVLRAIIWWITDDVDRSTKTAARVGQGVAFVFIGFGLAGFLLAGVFGGLWIAIIGWFLFEAARASYAQVAIAETLRGLRVADIMSRDCAVIDARENLQSFVDEQLLRTGRRCFIVGEDGNILGLITPADVRNVERGRWRMTSVGDVMRPLAELRTIRPDVPAEEAVAVLGREDVNQLPVVSHGRLEGILSRGHVLRILQARAELRM